MTEAPDLAAADPQWYKDAVIYQLHVKSFFDANNDGVGDFAGLMQKLDYVADLGVTAVWLLPFYPSPRRDDGYDIAEYIGVHPEYGSLDDAKAFLSHTPPDNRNMATMVTWHILLTIALRGNELNPDLKDVELSVSIFCTIVSAS